MMHKKRSADALISEMASVDHSSEERSFWTPCSHV